ncbi:UDP-N-acetylmuramoyl-L-alanyl-D-glutamate--2,6-diaminopimelate ligase [Kineococcus xinjiangensis]|uniref:UDP-N-acetylmuramoyl-L-alanyl-D-glutamate--2, 6-diaminopimelate ligase n=1 Tax=Kineococcus xinjiangensis TaxID=512762 RepID=UPI000CEC010F|nr:UDP-N-acetylmuramoyl-L-alanyl-D-glutamate--2,6-diaminopimelate ligase [Kineococcus xinjiangensis]
MPTSEPPPGHPRDPRSTGAPTLRDLAALLSLPAPAGAEDVVVTGATLDSRAVGPGDLYAALPGARAHGADFAVQAAASGAVAVLTDPAGAERVVAAGLPALVVPDPRAVLGEVAATVHGHPARELTTVGITGTNGKTTTAYLLEALLAAAGWRTGLIGTVETRIGEERVKSVRTTPESPDLHALFRRMRDAGVRACAMEVSSHALRLHRVDGAVLDVAVFTNLSQDHLDFHRDMEDYFAAKAELFTPAHSRCGIVAVDDEWGERLARTATVPVTTVRTSGGTGWADGAADWHVADVRAERPGSTFSLVSHDGRRLRLRCPLPGAFNVSNAALAAVAALEAGVPAEAVVRGSASAGAVPGRMQPVTTGAPGEPVVVVDFAHSPDALERVLATLRADTPGRLVVVLGAGGDRDAAKRPGMGATAVEGADVVVVTDDNPRSEEPAAIRAAVLAGARAALARGAAAELLEVPDRRAAVAAGLAACTGGHDTVLLAGKGHERGQEVAGRVLPFDDAEVAAELLRERARPLPATDPEAVPAPHSTPRGGTQ